MKQTVKVRAAALTAAAALGLLGLELGTAVAVESDLDPAPSSTPSSITQDTGSITIHKFTPTTSGNVEGKNNGTELAENTLTNLGAKPIKGVKFTIKQVKGLDIKTNEGWKNAAKLSAAFKTSKTEATITGFDCSTGVKCTLGNAQTITTNGDGIAKASSLPVGFYLVQEANEPADKVTVKGESETSASSLVGSEPFIISVPLTDATTRNKWLYDVHAYPKNSTVGIHKDVKDSNTPGAGNSGTGSRISYVINTDIPKNVKKLKQYVVLDPLDARLTYVDSADKVVLLNEAGAPISAATLTKGTDYNIKAKVYSGVTSTTNDPKPGTFVSVKFTPEGLAKLVKYRDDNQAVKVSWTLSADLKKLSEADSKIPNQATVIPDIPNNPNGNWDPDNPPTTPPVTPPGNPSNKVVSKYGKVVITKTGTDAEKLNGATFKLYKCDSNGNLTSFDGTKLTKQGSFYSDSDLNQNAISVNDKKEWVTGTDADGETEKTGKIAVQGLQLNDFKNNSTEKAGQRSEEWKRNHYYCLVETKAPQGYELLTQPIKFQLLQSDSSATKAVTVKDVPSNGGFHLPVTGGQGIALLSTAGGLLVAGSVIYLIALSRKRKRNG